MLIVGLFQLAIRTANLPATLKCYSEVLGLREVPRPASLTFSGAWLPRLCDKVKRAWFELPGTKQ